MEKSKTSVSDIDTYIAAFSPEVQIRLEEMRKIIREAAPGARETISYALPTFQLNGNLVHFGGFKNHVGFYPTPKGITAFDKELSLYKQGKGSVQFPFSEPLPVKLITKMVRFLVERNLQKKLKTN